MSCIDIYVNESNASKRDREDAVHKTGLFTDTSEHIRFLLFTFFLFFHFLVVGSVR